ncbi:MAG: hypothetical protein U1E70_16465 [Acetobacteraceae bacterium]
MNGQADQQQPLTRLTRLLRLRTIGVAWGVLAICLAILWLASVYTFRNDVAPAFRRQAETTGKGLAAHIARALEPDMTLASSGGVGPLLNAFVARHPGIAYAELRDSRQGPLYAARRADVEVQLDGPWDVAIPVLMDSRPVATLHLGVRILQDSALLRQTAWDALLLLIAVAPALAVVLVAFINRAMAVPSCRLQRLYAQLNAGDWTTRAGHAGAPELHSALAAVDMALERVAARRARTEWLAREVAAIRPRLAAQSRELVGSLPYTPQARAGPLARSDAQSRVMALYLALLADQLAGGVILLRPGGPLAAAVYAAGILFCPTRLARRMAPAATFALGCLMASAGNSLAWTADATPLLLLGRALAGCGIALLLGDRAVAGLPHGSFGRTCALMAVAASVSGTAAGSLLTTYIGPAAAVYISAAGTLLVASMALLDWWRTPDAGDRRERPAWVARAVIAGSGAVALAAAKLPWLSSLPVPETGPIAVLVCGVALCAAAWIRQRTAPRDPAP